MKIKKLEIFGFKSFADRAVFNFDVGVTGIVGPNGCGKSNVVDALRWVMGEQSAKHLRGDNMQDIIFNGSQNRGPLGMAEVVLTLENDGNLVPPEYSHFSEIQVARRLYRSGDSEYEINRRPARLKDITDLFLGTGVGTRAYSIIEQGRVTAIISAKPEERRQMIEEAAGITKYKAKRVAAERKMEATEQNLARVSDVIKEVANRLEVLEKQAKKAARFHEIEADIKNLEYHKATLHYFEIHATTRLLNESQALQQNEIAEKEVLFAQIEKDLLAKRDAQKEVESQLHLTQSLLYEADNAIALSKQNLAHLSAQIESTSRQQAQTHDEIRQSEARLGQLATEKTSLSDQEKNVAADLANAKEKLEQLNALYQTARNERAQFVQKTEELRAKVSQAQSTATKLQLDLQSESDRQKNAISRQSTLARDQGAVSELMTQVKERLDVLRAESTQAAQLKTTLESDKTTFESELQAVNTAYDSAERERKTKHEDLLKKQSRHKSLQEIESSFEWGSQALGEIMTKQKSDAMIGLLADFFEVPAEYETLVEEVLRHRVETVLVNNQAEMLRLAKHLSARRDGRVRFFATETTSEDNKTVGLPTGRSLVTQLKLLGQEKAVESLLGSVWLCENSDEAIELWPAAKKEGLTLVSKNGELFLPDGCIEAGQRANTTGVLGRKREIRDLEQQLAALATEVESLVKSQEERLTTKRALEQKLTDCRQRLQNVALSHARLDEALKGKEQEENRLKSQLEKLGQDSIQLAGDIQKAEENIAALKQAWAKSLETHQALLEDFGKHQQSQAQIDEDVAKKNEEVTTARIAAASLEQRLAGIAQTLKVVSQTTQDLSQKLAILAAKIKELAQSEQELAAQKEITEQKLAAGSAEREILATKLAEQKTINETHLNALLSDEGKLTQERQAIEQLRASLANLALALKEQELSHKTLHDRLIERYKIRVEEILCEFHLMPLPDIDLGKRIKDLERSRDHLGAINLAAIGEFEELKKRHQFLQGQVDDLHQALEQLQSAIAKVNRTTILRFEEAFNAINSRFSQVFPRLFRGGKAWLALTNPNDLLTTGVEIFAEPPGKKLASMALMSGGEKALTATSLIFAIFLIKPSPFCLLDEVDAPLDEANVERFSRLVKEMSKLSQFIVITHNKRTMESTDQIYGVTMEQAGISKALSIQVSRDKTTEAAVSPESLVPETLSP